MSSTGSASGIANANFANFDNFPKSCSADFASFGSSQKNAGVAEAAGVPADRYAALADLHNVFGITKPEQGTFPIHSITIKHQATTEVVRTLCKGKKSAANIDYCLLYIKVM